MYSIKNNLNIISLTRYSLGLTVAINSVIYSANAQTLPLSPNLIDFNSDEGKNFLIESKSRESSLLWSCQ
jgi:hypothetical protein